jgi:hypothetical protein
VNKSFAKFLQGHKNTSHHEHIVNQTNPLFAICRLRVVVCVDLCELLPLLWEIALGKNCRDRARRNACAAINALNRIDKQHVFRCEVRFAFFRMDAVYGTGIHACGVFHVNARFGNDVGRRTSFLMSMPASMSFTTLVSSQSSNCLLRRSGNPANPNAKQARSAFQILPRCLAWPDIFKLTVQRNRIVVIDQLK